MSSQDLHKKYSHIRKTRPDGNCFYRAFGFAHLESLLEDSKELQRLVFSKGPVLSHWVHDVLRSHQTTSSKLAAGRLSRNGLIKVTVAPCPADLTVCILP